LEEQKSKDEVLRKRKKVKEELYPLLVEKSESIEDAKMLLSVNVLAIKQAFNNKMKEIKVSELDLLNKINSEGDQYVRFRDLLMMFQDEFLPDALEMIDGMVQEIDGLVQAENKKRPLKELKTNFYETT
jgi:hypothetical protein